MRVSVDIILYKFKVLSNGECPLVVRFTKDRKRKYIRIGISVNPNYWNKLKNRPKYNCPNKEYIENIIIEKLAIYQKQIIEMQSMSREFSLDQIIETIKKPTKNTTIENYVKGLIEQFIKKDKIGNAAHYQSLLNSLQSFTKLPQLLFIDVDTSFLNRYENFLKERGNKGNTISIKMRTLKAVYNKAIKDGVVKKKFTILLIVIMFLNLKKLLLKDLL